MCPIINNRYAYWHKLQFRTPPEGLNHKECWLAIKMARLSQLRLISLMDLNEREFRFGIPDPTMEYLHKIDQFACGHIQTIDRDTINPKTQEKYMMHSLIEEAITSSQLEGAISTRKVAKKMIETERQPRDKSEQMILNNYRTMLMIKDVANKKLSKELIFDLHRHLTELTLDNADSVGRFRNETEHVEVYDNMVDFSLLEKRLRGNELVFIPTDNLEEKITKEA